jgi:type IX secretion system PorP/SprF family membrane protein
MKMKKILTLSAIVFLFLIVKSGMAQQEPLFSLYHQQLFLINPASTGDQDYMQAFIDARKQWSGFEMAPRTGAFGIHDSYNDKMGLGVLITGDKAGMIERLSGNLNYSYKLHFSREKKHNLVFGIGVGFIENKINTSEGRVQDFDPLLYADNDGFAFDARFGMLYNFKGFELGAAIPQILDNDVKYQRSNLDDYSFELKRHYLLHTGYRFSFYKKKFDEEMNIVKEQEEKFYIKPSILYKMALSAPEQIDINLVVGGGRNNWLGFTYRPTDKSMVVSGGIQINSLGIAYAYQIANTLPTEYSNGTHEIMLTYKIISQAREDRKLDEKLAEMKDRQQLMKSQVEQLNTDVDGLKSRPVGNGNEDNKGFEERLQSEIDSLRNQLKNIKTGDGGTTTIIKEPVDQSELDRLNKELEELKKNVLEIKGEKVYELNKIQGSGNNVSYDKTSVEDGCYVIVYSFRKLEYARKGVEIANSKGYTANILYNETRKWYYIYTAKYDELKPALEDMRKVRQGEYNDSWVHIYKK